MSSAVESSLKSRLMKPKTNTRWFMICMVCMGTVINYLDRTNFAVATPSLMKEFGLGTGDMGILMSAFFITYTAAMIPSGFFIDRLGPKIVLGIGSTLWGAVTMATAVCWNYASFFAMRVALGLAEAPAWPASARVVSVWVPKSERTRCSSLFDASGRLGGAVAPPIVAFIILQWGWKASFVITGAFGIIWAIWWWVNYSEPAEHPTLTAEELAWIRQDEIVTAAGTIETRHIPISKMIFYPVIAKASLGYLLYLWMWFTFIYWIPTYLMKAKGLSLKEMGIYASFPILTAVVLEIFGGWIFDKWYEKGASTNMLRRTGMGIGMFTSAIFLYILTLTTTPFWAVFWLSAACGMQGFGASNVWAIPSDIAPYGQAGGVGGFYSFIGTLGALFAPLATGFIAETRFGFDGAFTVCAILAFLGGFLFVFNNYDRLEVKEKHYRAVS